MSGAHLKKQNSLQRYCLEKSDLRNETRCSRDRAGWPGRERDSPSLVKQGHSGVWGGGLWGGGVCPLPRGGGGGSDGALVVTRTGLSPHPEIRGEASG